MHHVIAAKMQDATRGQADEQALTQVHRRVRLSASSSPVIAPIRQPLELAYLDVYGRCHRRRRLR